MNQWLSSEPEKSRGTILCGVMSRYFEMGFEKSNRFEGTTKMYELWTTQSINLVDTYATAKEAESALRDVVKRKGTSSLKQHVLMSGDSEDEDSVFVAEDEAILKELEKLRLLEDLREVLASAEIELDFETSAFVGQYLTRFPHVDTNKEFASETWIKGFLAAALHNVRIDIVKGELEIGKPLDTPVFESKSLTPTG